MISLGLPALHACLCVATRGGLLPSEGSWGWFVIFLIDFPFSILLLPLQNIADPLLVFGILGSAWWYLISRLGIYCAKRLSEIPKKNMFSRLAAATGRAARRRQAWWQVVFPLLALISIGAFTLVPGCYHRWREGAAVRSHQTK